MKYDKKHWDKAVRFCEKVRSDLPCAASSTTVEHRTSISISLGGVRREYRGSTASVWASVWFDLFRPHLDEQAEELRKQLLGLESAGMLGLTREGTFRQFCEEYCDATGRAPYIQPGKGQVRGYEWGIEGETPYGWAPTEGEAWRRLALSLLDNHPRRLRKAREDLEAVKKQLKKGRRYFGDPVDAAPPGTP